VVTNRQRRGALVAPPPLGGAVAGAGR